MWYQSLIRVLDEIGYDLVAAPKHSGVGPGVDRGFGVRASKLQLKPRVFGREIVLYSEESLTTEGMIYTDADTIERCK